MSEKVEEKAPGKLVEYWKANIATNYKKISAVMGSMILMVMDPMTADIFL